MAGHLFGGEMPKEETFYEEVGKKIVYWTVPKMPRMPENHAYFYHFPHFLIKCDDKIREIRLGSVSQVGSWDPWIFMISVRNSEAEKGNFADQHFEKENIVLKLRSVEEPKAINSPDVGKLKCITEPHPGCPHVLSFEVLPAEGHTGMVFLNGFHVALEITVLKKMKVAKRRR
jgi:hypothetical protein